MYIFVGKTLTFIMKQIMKLKLLTGTIILSSIVTFGQEILSRIKI
jgi:hypothetical protein